MNWQPIETAPKHAKGDHVIPILLFRPPTLKRFSHAIGHWDHHWNEWQWLYGGDFCGATHWMPLPAPPQQDASNEFEEGD